MVGFSNRPQTVFWQIHGFAANAPAGGPTLLYCGLRLLFPRPSSGFFAVAEIPAARSFAIRLMSFTGAGLVSGNWTVPFRSLYPPSSSSSLSVAKNVADAANSE
jgi:hypothetical protein